LLGLSAIFVVAEVVLLLDLAVSWETMGALFFILMSLGFLWWGVSPEV